MMPFANPSSTIRPLVLGGVGGAFLLLGVTAAQAGLPPSDRCEVGKLKAVAAYSSCLLKAEAKGLAKALAPDFTKCASTFLTKFAKYESSAGPGVCPSENDVADIRDRTDDFETTVAILLAGGSIPAGTCGNGTVDVGEGCDVGNLDGETCGTQAFYNGTLRCSPGCQFDTSSCHAVRFEDTGATVLDHGTGLEWEKKDASDAAANAANPHDVDNTYTWAVGASNTTSSGTVFSDFLFKLNGVTDVMTITTSGCFDNHCDWRLPTIDELKTIAILSPGCGAAPCVEDAVFLPTRSLPYWSHSTRNGLPTGAYFLHFTNGASASDFKTTAYYARAVRTGS